jgi:RHS repeat-associated protein
MVLAAAEARCRELWAEVLTFYLLYGAKDDENAAGGEGLSNGGEGTRERYYHSTDHEGSTDVITDSSGNIVWDGDYEAFGSVVRSNGSIRFDASYTGKEFDVDTGLYYFNARWYDPTLGRFISEDPARDGDNWFAYVGNNPMSHIDPNGLEDTPLIQPPAGALPYVGTINTGFQPADTFLAGLGNIWNMAAGTANVGLKTVGLAAEGVDALGNLATKPLFGLSLGETAMAVSPLGGEINAALSGLKGLATAGAAEKALPYLGPNGIWKGEILSTTASDDLTMYRVWGGKAPQAGGWLTPVKPTSAAAARSSLALPAENTAEYFSTVTVPAGTRFQIGTAGSGFGQPGGGVQLNLLDKIPASSFGPGVPLQ